MFKTPIQFFSVREFLKNYFDKKLSRNKQTVCKFCTPLGPEGLNGSKVANIEVLHEALGAFYQMLEISEYPRWLPHLILTTILDFIAQIYKIIIKMDFL